jgi:hypothetical protein
MKKNHTIQYRMIEDADESIRTKRSGVQGKLRKDIITGVRKRTYSFVMSSSSPVSSSSFGPSDRFAEDVRSVMNLFSAGLDEKAQAECNRIWFEREMRGKALESILALHPTRVPSYDPEETPALLNELHTWRILGRWILEKRGDVNIFLVRNLDEIDMDEPAPGAGILEECLIDGTLVHPCDIRLDNENYVYFGVPVSVNPELPYRRDAEQINLQTIGTSSIYDLHEHEGMIVGDKTDPTLEKDAYVVHMGLVPHSVRLEKNDYFTSFLIRNMQTQEESYFVFERENEETMNPAPMLLRGEFYFMFYQCSLRVCTCVVHGRSRKTVAKFHGYITSVVTCTNYIVLGKGMNGRTTVRVLQ